MKMKLWPDDWAPKPNISISTMKTYLECPRKFWYSNAPNEVKRQFQRQYKLERNLTSDNMLVGQIVDEVIKGDLKLYRAIRDWTSDLHHAGQGVLKEILKCSEEYLRVRDNKDARIPFEDHNPLERIYYGEDYSPIELDAKMNQVNRCLDIYAKSGFREFMEVHWEYEWQIPLPVTKRPVPWYFVGNMPVYASFDFIMYRPDHGYVIDWKTGKRTEASMKSAREQLHLYAGFLNTEWNVPLDNIHVGAVWLQESGMPEFEPTDVSFLNDIYRNLRDHFAIIETKFEEGTAAELLGARIFPMTDNDRFCRYCQYRSCSGYKKAIQKRREYDEMVAPDEE